MAYSRATGNQSFMLRVGLLIVVCTGALTLAFFGLVAFISGDTAGVADRVPFYVLGMAVSFVAGVVGLEQRRRSARPIITLASALGVVAFVFLTLAGEGVVYAARNPNQALASQRFLYLVAAGLIATGVGYWGLRHRVEMLRALG